MPFDLRVGLTAGDTGYFGRAGGLPLLLPPGEPRLAEWMSLCDGVLLTGGGDLGATSYGGAAHAENYSVDAERDGTELEFVRAALATRRPLFCICRPATIHPW